jgi:hypothetical protein
MAKREIEFQRLFPKYFARLSGNLGRNLGNLGEFGDGNLGTDGTFSNIAAENSVFYPD